MSANQESGNSTVKWIFLGIAFIVLISIVSSSVKSCKTPPSDSKDKTEKTGGGNYNPLAQQPTNTVDRNKSRETHFATMSGTRVYLKEYWSLVPLGKVKGVMDNGGHFHDGPAVKSSNDHFPAGWCTFYPDREKGEKSETVEFQIWQ